MKSTNRWQGLRSIRLTQNTSKSTKVLAKVRHSNTQPSLGLKDKHQKSNGETLPICMMTLVEHTSAWRLRLWPQALLPGVFYIKECTNVPGFRGVWMGKEKRNSCCIQQWLSGQPKKKKKKAFASQKDLEWRTLAPALKLGHSGGKRDFWFGAMVFIQ